ncbi:MAG: GNAT family N-acetyltransferase [Gammaproteobacteria bacterium]|nr:GNAT family N-acetyltransferase [Gammaproteobacteria bacterium]
MEVLTHLGAEIGAFIEPLGRYRIEIFREFPYLYDGDMEYERHYLSRYLQSDESFLLLGQDASGIACACTGIPLAHEMEEFKAPFVDRGAPVTDKFYLGEIMIRKDLRGQGLGTRVMNLALSTIARARKYQNVVLCTVIRPSSHPLKPADYTFNDNLWRHAGFSKLTDFTVLFPWKDLGDAAETLKPMCYWLKPLNQNDADRM